MTFEEFVKNNPAEASAAAQCKSIDEFKKLADDNGFKFEDDKTAEEAFEYVKENCSNAELDDDALMNVAGGKGGSKPTYEKITRDQLYTNIDNPNDMVKINK